jgi:quinoprotein glucose dehydrogenase
MKIPTHLPLLIGTPSFGGTLVTRGGLIFMAATLDHTFRAVDTKTGRTLWEFRLPAGAQATPMTYMAGGKQYIVLTAGGHAHFGTKPGDDTIAFTLPDTGAQAAQ